MTKKSRFVKGMLVILAVAILLKVYFGVRHYLVVKVLPASSHVAVTTQSNGRFTIYHIMLDDFSALLFKLIVLAVPILVGVGHYFMKKHHRKKLAINGD